MEGSERLTQLYQEGLRLEKQYAEFKKESAKYLAARQQEYLQLQELLQAIKNN
ncbi:hypothetical protein [Candidatus Tisiphia endosymbiont of Micropterix aruncella]|uniref:hypothetical protein n=1 Tax=Candidatus Tisiphia endosymbiont of Micropterix aruncella TaxID=3066271 RepID=UPI003AA7FC1A